MTALIAPLLGSELRVAVRTVRPRHKLVSHKTTYSRFTMNNVDAPAESASSHSHAVWAFTLAVAGLPVVFGLYQVGVFFDEAFPHLYWSRTLPALAGVTLAIAGIAAPLWILINRNVFCRRSLPRQWLTCVGVLLLMSFAYLVPFVMLAEAARKSHAILPYTPSAFLIYRPDDGAPLSFGVAGGLGTGHGGWHQNNDQITADWTAWLEPPGLVRPSGADPIVRFDCNATLDVDLLSIDLEINTGRTVRFETRGFIEPNIQQKGKPVALPIELGAGTHRFTIRAKRSDLGHR